MTITKSASAIDLIRAETQKLISTKKKNPLIGILYCADTIGVITPIIRYFEQFGNICLIYPNHVYNVDMVVIPNLMPMQRIVSAPKISQTYTIFIENQMFDAYAEKEIPVFTFGDSAYVPYNLSCTDPISKNIVPAISHNKNMLHPVATDIKNIQRLLNTEPIINEQIYFHSNHYLSLLDKQDSIAKILAYAKNKNTLPEVEAFAILRKNYFDYGCLGEPYHIENISGSFQKEAYFYAYGDPLTNLCILKNLTR